MENHKFSYYNGKIEDSRVMGTTNLRHMFNDIVTTDAKTIEMLREIRTTTDASHKARLKTRLKGYTPCVVCRRTRTYDNIERFSGLLGLDFDKLESVEYAKEFRDYLFNEYRFIYGTWLSSSGKGVRGIVHIPICTNVDEFKSRFWAIEQILGVYQGFDRAPQNAVLPLFQSHDPEMLIRDEAVMFTKMYNPPVPPPRPKIPITADSADMEKVIDIITSAIDKIGDNGHPQLRGASFALGGYIGAGYIGLYDAITLIDDLIDTNKYLSIKPAVYKKTARTMLNKGQSKPLYL
jgi:hypothetical protein